MRFYTSGITEIFFEKGNTPASASIDAYGLFITLKKIIQSNTKTSHGSHNVSTKMSQKKKARDMKSLCNIMSAAYQHSSRTSCRNPVLPSPTGCTQYPKPDVLPLAVGRTIYGSNE
jgi:hypothetical protein